jgi:hypothetical protein
MVVIVVSNCSPLFCRDLTVKQMYHLQSSIVANSLSLLDSRLEALYYTAVMYVLHTPKFSA